MAHAPDPSRQPLPAWQDGWRSFGRLLNTRRDPPIIGKSSILHIIPVAGHCLVRGWSTVLDRVLPNRPGGVGNSWHGRYANREGQRRQPDPPDRTPDPTFWPCSVGAFLAPFRPLGTPTVCRTVVAIAGSCFACWIKRFLRKDSSYEQERTYCWLGFVGIGVFGRFDAGRLELGHRCPAGRPSSRAVASSASPSVAGRPSGGSPGLDRRASQFRRPSRRSASRNRCRDLPHRHVRSLRSLESMF